MDHWRTVWTAAATAASAVVDKRGQEALHSVRRVVRAQKASLKSLVTAFSAGWIDKPTFLRQLREERRAMDSELRASPGIGTVSAQASARAFFRVVQRESSHRSGRRV